MTLKIIGAHDRIGEVSIGNCSKKNYTDFSQPSCMCSLEGVNLVLSALEDDLGLELS